MNNQIITYFIIIGSILLCYNIIMSIKDHKKELEEQPEQTVIRPRSKSRNRFFEFCYANGKRFQKLNDFFDKVGHRIDKIGKVRMLYCFFMVVIMLHFIDPLDMEKYFSFLLVIVQPTNFAFIFVGLLVVKMLSVIIGKSDLRSLGRDFAFGCGVMAIGPLLLYFSNMLISNQ